MVLVYHVLWELTHVCFEHAGLLTPDAEECDDDVCITCSDEGRLAEVIAAAGDRGTAVRTRRTAPSRSTRRSSARSSPAISCSSTPVPR